MEDKMSHDYIKNMRLSQNYFSPGMKIPGAVSYDVKAALSRVGEKEIKDKEKISDIDELLSTVNGITCYTVPEQGLIVICNKANEKYIIFVNTKEKVKKINNKMISTQLTAEQALDAIWWDEKLISDTNRMLEKFRMSISGGPKAKSIVFEPGNKRICCFIERHARGLTTVEVSRGHFRGKPATPAEIGIVKANVAEISKSTDDIILKLINEIINSK